MNLTVINDPAFDPTANMANDVALWQRVEADPEGSDSCVLESSWCGLLQRAHSGTMCSGTMRRVGVGVSMYSRSSCSRRA